MKDRSHIVWPAVIIALLLASVALMFTVMAIARSDGGVQVVEDYYARAAGWDSIATVTRSSRALEWKVAVTLDQHTAGRTGELTITDASGAAIADLAGSIEVSRPQTAGLLGTHALKEVEDQPGTYQFEFPYAAAGLWDLKVDASIGPSRLYQIIRINL